MGIPWDDVVVITKGKTSEEPAKITVNCPDKAGLGCDLCRITLEFGLLITRGDVSTDGRWCYVVLWVVPDPSLKKIDWESLENRLLSVCPPCLYPVIVPNQPASPSDPPVYLLKLFCSDQNGLLHSVTEVLCELELIIQRVKVMTIPDGRALDFFFITDCTEQLHLKKRQDETRRRIYAAVGECCISCELELAGPEYSAQPPEGSSFSPAIADELFSNMLLNKESSRQALTAEITVDNQLSTAHTLLQIHCADRKGLLYDILRTFKEFNMRMTYGRTSPSESRRRVMDLFIQQMDGRKIVDDENLAKLCSRLKEEILNPVRVVIADRGPETELVVANPVELSRKGRPRVFFDVTCTLKSFGLCIFSAEIGRHSANDREWEVYRFLLVDKTELPLASSKVREKIVNGLRRKLMGW